MSEADFGVLEHGLEGARCFGHAEGDSLVALDGLVSDFVVWGEVRETNGGEWLVIVIKPERDDVERHLGSPIVVGCGGSRWCHVLFIFGGLGRLIECFGDFLGLLWCQVDEGGSGLEQDRAIFV